MDSVLLLLIVNPIHSIQYAAWLRPVACVALVLTIAVEYAISVNASIKVADDTWSWHIDPHSDLPWRQLVRWPNTYRIAYFGDTGLVIADRIVLSLGKSIYQPPRASSLFGSADSRRSLERQAVVFAECCSGVVCEWYLVGAVVTPTENASNNMQHIHRVRILALLVDCAVMWSTVMLVAVVFGGLCKNLIAGTRVLRGRCGWCGYLVVPGSSKCPECGRLNRSR